MLTIGLICGMVLFFVLYIYTDYKKEACKLELLILKKIIAQKQGYLPQNLDEVPVIYKLHREGLVAFQGPLVPMQAKKGNEVHIAKAFLAD